MAEFVFKRLYGTKRLPQARRAVVFVPLRARGTPLCAKVLWLLKGKLDPTQERFAVG